MATRTEVNTEFDKRLASETTFQDAEFAENGRYTQKLADDKFGIGTTFETHVYHAPGDNHGWTLIVTNTEGADDYRRMESTGIEKAHRDRDWTKLEKGII